MQSSVCFLCISHTGQLRCADWDGERPKGGKGCELPWVGAGWCALELWGSVAEVQCEGTGEGLHTLCPVTALGPFLALGVGALHWGMPLAHLGLAPGELPVLSASPQAAAGSFTVRSSGQGPVGPVLVFCACGAGPGLGLCCWGFGFTSLLMSSASLVCLQMYKSDRCVLTAELAAGHNTGEALAFLWFSVICVMIGRQPSQRVSFLSAFRLREAVGAVPRHGGEQMMQISPEGFSLSSCAGPWGEHWAHPWGVICALCPVLCPTHALCAQTRANKSTVCF